MNFAHRIIIATSLFTLTACAGVNPGSSPLPENNCIPHEDTKPGDLSPDAGIGGTGNSPCPKTNGAAQTAN